MFGQGPTANRHVAGADDRIGQRWANAVIATGACSGTKLTLAMVGDTAKTHKEGKPSAVAPWFPAVAGPAGNSYPAITTGVLPGMRARTLCGPSVDHNSSNLSADLRRKRSETLLTALLSQLRAIDEIWGSRGRRFKSCRPDHTRPADAGTKHHVSGLSRSYQPILLVRNRGELGTIWDLLGR
jgi:hypothetical protein